MIHLPPPQPVLNKDIRISGDVEIHPTASIAPGVILQAAPDCRIKIGADVCIGMGVIINASQGSIEIANGAILGSGVLIIGECQIGNNACIGTAVTIFQVNVEATQVVQPGSILGDASRKVDLELNSPQKQSSNSSVKQGSQSKPSRVGSNGFYSPQSQAKKATVKTPEPQPTTPQTPPIPTTETVVTPEVKPKNTPVVGRVYINQLLVTLFPHNKDLNSPTKKLE